LPYLFGLTTTVLVGNNVHIKLFLCLTLKAVIVEKSVSEKFIDKNGRRDFEAISASLGYSF
jgi:hypothetical protein